MELPIEIETEADGVYKTLDAMSSETFCFLTDQTLIITSNERWSARLTKPDEIIGLYVWSAQEKKFDVVKPDPVRGYLMK